MFSFDTRFRVLPKNYGVYDGEKVFDVDEIVVATDTLPLRGLPARPQVAPGQQRLLERRLVRRRGRASPSAHGIRQLGMVVARCCRPWRATAARSRGFLRGLRGRDQRRALPDPRGVRRVLLASRTTSRKLQRGEIGDNLMYRYRAIASFFLWEAVCEAAMNATRQLLEERGVPGKIRDFDTFWKDFHTYIATAARIRPRHRGDPVLGAGCAALRFPGMARGEGSRGPERFPLCVGARSRVPPERGVPAGDGERAGGVDHPHQGAVQAGHAHQGGLAGARMRSLRRWPSMEAR